MQTAARYSVAVVATLVALASTVALSDFLAPMRLFFLWCAVLLSAVIGGFGPALVAIAISMLGAAFVIFDPIGSLSIHGTEDALRLAFFALFAAGISAVAAQRRRAEERVRQSELRALFINRAGEALASSLDLKVTLRTLGKLCVPALAEWCAVHFATEDGSYERVVVEHTDPARQRLVEQLGRDARPAPEHDPIVQVLRSGKSQVVEHVSDEALAAGATAEQLEVLRKLGFRSWVIAPMLTAGRTIGTLTLVRGDSGGRFTPADVALTEELARRAAAAADNARLYEAAEAANRAKDDFLATLSHELRTPLTAIAGWAQMLQLGITDPETTRLAIDTIARSATIQRELVDDLLDVSRVVSGTLFLNLVTLNVATLAEEIVTAARPAAEAKALSLTFAAAEDVVLVRGDSRRVRQIVWNVVNNAVKFTPAGGSVSVSVSVRDEHARIEVVDTGEGIDPSFLPHVWERFRQADSSSSRRHGGLGLGLAVVSHLVDLHGGTAIAESEGLGRGAKFTIELPLAGTAEANAVAEDEIGGAPAQIDTTA